MANVSNGLTEKMKRFCREYFTNGGNGTNAYLKVYNSNNEQVAANESSLLLQRKDIREYLQSMNKPLEKKAISEREKKRAWLWNMIENAQNDSDRIRAMDILNKMDSEYINIQRIESDQTPITDIDTDKLIELTKIG